MSDADRVGWDERYRDRDPARVGSIALPAVFAPCEELFPVAGHALDLACGQGHASLWLARRGLEVRGVDISPVAVACARELAREHGVDARCDFAVVDLDDGLPAGPPLNVVLCHKFRDARLDDAMVARLAPGGLLAVSALSEVGARPGTFRVGAGELPRAFAGLEIIGADEGGGEAWLVARRSR